MPPKPKRTQPKKQNFQTKQDEGSKAVGFDDAEKIQKGKNTNELTDTDQKPGASLATIILEILLLAEILGLIFLCPYTKVEESFNMQAMHDLLFLGPGNLRSFDHFSFPGVVPRTFLGALAVAFLASPIHLILQWHGFPRHWSLYACRGVLGLAGWAAARGAFRAAGRRFGRPAGAAALAVTCCQFHLPFYLSRPLPNTFALILLLFAYTAWLDGKGYRVVLVAAAAAAVFRCDVLVLAAPLGLALLAQKQVTLGNAIIMGVASTAMSIFTTVAYDSIMWQKLVWPEGAVLFFNTVENKSSEWGTSPPLWYLYSALPRALLATALFIPFGLIKPLAKGKKLSSTLMSPLSLLDKEVLPYFCVPVVFIGLYSVLPHKELRFIFPALPLFNIVAGVGLSKLISISGGGGGGGGLGGGGGGGLTLLRLGGAGGALLGSAAAAAAVFLAAARANYPGGEALRRLHALAPSPQSINLGRPYSVHIGVDAAMTGVARFWEQGDPAAWVYSKQEGPGVDLAAHDFLLAAASALEGPEGNFKAIAATFEVVAVAEGFQRFNVRTLRAETAPEILVLRNARRKELLRGSPVAAAAEAAAAAGTA